MTRYPPLYYAVIGGVLRVSLAAGLSGESALLTARIASGLLALGVLSAALVALLKRFTLTPALAVIVAGFTPMAAFLAASINPSGLEVAAAMLVASLVLAIRSDLRHRGSTTRWALIGLILGSAALTFTRPFGWIWASLLAASLAVPPTLRRWREAPVLRIPYVVVAALAVVLSSGFLWFAFATRTRSLGVGSDGWGETPVWARVTAVVLKFGEVGTQSVGLFGWLDTPLPVILVLGWVAGTSWLFFTWFMYRNAAEPGALALVGILLLSSLVVIFHSLVVVYGWQGRYLLPILGAAVVLTAGGVHAACNSRLVACQRHRVVLASLIGYFATVHIAAVFWNMWRYAYGAERVNIRLPYAPLPIGTPDWTPAIGESNFAAIVGVSAAMLVAAATTSWAIPRVSSSTVNVEASPSSRAIG